MPRRISWEITRDIVRFRFNGIPVREVARRFGVSDPTVRGRIRGFIDEAKNGGIVVAARLYGIEDQVNGLLKVSEDLKSNDFLFSRFYT